MTTTAQSYWYSIQDCEVTTSDQQDTRHNTFQKVCYEILTLSTLKTTLVDARLRARISQWAVQSYSGPTIQGTVCCLCGEPSSFHLTHPQGCCHMEGDEHELSQPLALTAVDTEFIPYPTHSHIHTTCRDAIHWKTALDATARTTHDYDDDYELYDDDSYDDWKQARRETKSY